MVIRLARVLCTTRRAGLSAGVMQSIPRIRAMQRAQLVRPAAFIWGLVVFMPVGLDYTGFGLTLLALLIAGGWQDRYTRLRAHPLWWPTLVFVGWTLVVLALRPHYPQTGENLVHGLRIAATILIALALTREEAIWGLRGFGVAAIASLVMIALYHTVGFPVVEAWRGVLILVGNKSISNALLLTIVGASAGTLGLYWLAEEGRPYRALMAFALPVAVIAIVAGPLPSRTSLVAMLAALLLACLHQWRRQLRMLALAMVIGGAAIGVGIWQSPNVQQKFELGVKEVEAAQAGAVSEGSWVVRYYMYRDTAKMMLDRPIAGWGIGGWTEQWHLRGPKLLADYNMPHNDYLWMGAQAGIPGALTLLAIMLVGLWHAWRRDDLTGRLAFVTMAILALATSLNSALRDAQIGLCLLWVAMLYLRLVDEDGEPWEEVMPQRKANVSLSPNA